MDISKLFLGPLPCLAGAVFLRVEGSRGGRPAAPRLDAPGPLQLALHGAPGGPAQDRLEVLDGVLAGRELPAAEPSVDGRAQIDQSKLVKPTFRDMDAI